MKLPVSFWNNNHQQAAGFFFLSSSFGVASFPILKLTAWASLEMSTCVDACKKWMETF
jgi:hypothetical protein